MKVFIGGSRSINELDENVFQVLFDELNAESEIFVGDADGVDFEIQKFCSTQAYKNVTVFASNGKARNNIGSFSVRNVPVDKNTFSKEFFTKKDIAMVNEADYGIVVWDGKSKGTLSQVSRLVKQNKPCHVYLAEQKHWVLIENENSLKTLTSKNTSVNTASGSYIRQLSFI